MLKLDVLVVAAGSDGNVFPILLEEEEEGNKVGRCSGTD